LSVHPSVLQVEPTTRVAATETSLTAWRVRREEESEYRKRYLGPEIDGSWTTVPAAEWTLPALASGKVLGVQGWFYLRQDIILPEVSGGIRLHVRPQAYHNLGLVYLNGRECGGFMVERPGAESVFDVTDLARPGEPNTLAIRLYRNSLDCHDRGVSGFSLLRFECGDQTIDVTELKLAQERRDFGELAGWAGCDTSGSEWTDACLPHELDMNRAGDTLWLRADLTVANPAKASLRLEGTNCIVSIFTNGEYVVKSPYLPCTLDLTGSLTEGINNLALRITPDNSEHYQIPQGERYGSWIQNGLLPLGVKLSKVVLVS
jgi:hypothetical protein